MTAPPDAAPGRRDGATPGRRDGAAPDRNGGCKALVADKWSLVVIAELGGGPRRFTELRRVLPAVSQRMLTATLRTLERDGILTRTVHAVMPPHVSYELTPLGHSFLEAAGPLMRWSTGNLPHLTAARASYDAAQTKKTGPGQGKP